MDCGKGNDYVIIMRDWNSVVGEGRDGDEISGYRIGRVEKKKKLVEYCRREEYIWRGNSMLKEVLEGRLEGKRQRKKEDHYIRSNKAKETLQPNTPLSLIHI